MRGPAPDFHRNDSGLKSGREFCHPSIPIECNPCLKSGVASSAGCCFLPSLLNFVPCAHMSTYIYVSEHIIIMSIIGKPPEDLVDREDEVSRIVDAMADPKANANYALVGHRRIGKSTILAKVKKILNEDNQVIVGYIDLGEFRHSPVEFAETLTESLTVSYSKTLPRASKAVMSVKSAIRSEERRVGKECRSRW